MMMNFNKIDLNNYKIKDLNNLLVVVIVVDLIKIILILVDLNNLLVVVIVVDLNKIKVTDFNKIIICLLNK